MYGRTRPRPLIFGWQRNIKVRFSPLQQQQDTLLDPDALAGPGYICQGFGWMTVDRHNPVSGLHTSIRCDTARDDLGDQNPVA